MTYRVLEPTSDRLQISVLDKPGSGGPEHLHSNRYQIRNFDASTNPAWDGMNQHFVTLLMQNGPVTAGKPANGLTLEVLLAIVIDQLGMFQAGPANSPENARALEHCGMALAAVRQRPRAEAA